METVYGSEVCRICYENIACVRLTACNHCVTCQICTDQLITSAAARGRNARCIVCTTEFTDAQTAMCLVHLEPTSVSNAQVLDDDLYPFGYILMSGTPDEWRQCSSVETLNAVREAMTAVQAGTLTETELRIRMMERLTPAQQQIMYAELIKDVDLHDVLIKIVDADSMKQLALLSAGRVMTHVLHGDDNKALFGRAAISMAVDVGEYAMMNVSNFSTGEGISNALVGIVFCAIDTYRWGVVGDLTSTQLAIRYAEHTVGCTAAYGGAMVGFTAGTMVGGPLLGLLSMFLCGLASDYLGRKAVRSTANGILKNCAGGKLKAYEDVELTAARVLGVDLRSHSRSEAHKRFRTKLLSVHPDKFMHATDKVKEEKLKESVELISAWTIVRGYYIQNPGKDDDVSHETFIDMILLKVRTSVDAAWEVVKSNFAEVPFVVTDPELQEVVPYTVHL